MKPILRLALWGLILASGALLWARQGPNRQGSVRQGIASQPPPSQGSGTSKPAPTAADEEARAAAEEVQYERTLQAFQIADYDKNGWLSFRELGQSLNVDRPRYLVYDWNRDGKVTEQEFSLVSIESYRRYGTFKIPTPNPDDPSAAQLLEGLRDSQSELDAASTEYVPVEASSILELFGKSERREMRDGSVPEPDLLVGPVFPFRRLDQNNDGGIDAEDLTVLLLGSGLDARPAALIASLDLDGDGRISQSEFERSMQSWR